MAIQNRRGVYSDFTPTKMVPGELAVVQSGDPDTTSGQSIYAAFLAGQIKRLATEEDLDNVDTELARKVDKTTGKGLSTNDYTDAEKTKLAGIAAGAEVNVQPDWNQASSGADDYIKNKPTKTSDFTNDGDGTSNFATESYVQLNGGKIDTISVNGTQQTITNKNVDIPVPVIDSTLTQTGKAADAKVVGDELADVKNDLNVLEADLEGETEVQEGITFVYGYYINLRDGTTVNLSTPVADQRYKYAIVGCSAGDKFLINAYGGSAPRAYGFVDSNNTKLYASDADTNVLNQTVTAPANSAKIIINDRFSDSSDLKSYKIVETEGIGDNFVRFDKAQTKTEAEKAIARVNIGVEDISGLSDEAKAALMNCFAHVRWVDEHGQDYYDALYDALYGETFNYGIYEPDVIVNGKYIDDNGDIQTGTPNASFYIEDYIPVVRSNYWIGMNPSSLRVYDPFQTPVQNPTNESNWRISEYDESKNFIKQTQFYSGHNICASTLLSFDSNTKYIRIGWYDTNSSTNDKEFDIENPSNIAVWPVDVGNIDASTGADAASTTRTRTVGYIPVSDTITITGCPFYDSWSEWISLWTSVGYSQDSFFYVVRCYDSSKAYLGTLNYNGSGTMKQDISNVSLPEGTAYIRMLFQTETNGELAVTLVNHLITINGTRYYLGDATT